MTSPRRIGLVLGGGGVLGAAWLIGALDTIFQASGWYPGDADHIVGTSAGSVVGSLVAGGISTDVLVAHQRGQVLPAETAALEIPTAVEASRYRIAGRIPRLLLGSPQLAVRSALQPWRYPPATAMAGWLGRGMLSTDAIGQVVRLVTAQDGWSVHQKLWIVGVDYATGRRVVFGTPDSPEAQLPEAVRASCAIPGFYKPVRIGGHRYIDGGTWSPSNLDLVAREKLDLVICLNPTSSLNPGPATTMLESAERRIRVTNGRRLGREARKVREAGTKVLLLQPLEADLAAMGVNLMNPKRRQQVLETSLRTVRKRLREPDAAEVIEQLKASSRHSIPVDSDL